MEITRCIKERRSVRKYLNKNVPLKLILESIDAAHFAPSSGNLQNWIFIIVKDQEAKNKIAESCLDQTWISESPSIIIICSDRERMEKFYEKHKNKFSIQNCSLAAQNLMLRAFSLGLGTCFISGFSKMILKRILELPNNIEPEAVITIGYSAEKPLSKRSLIENCTFFETYSNRIADKSLWPIEKHFKKLFSKFK